MKILNACIGTRAIVPIARLRENACVAQHATMAGGMRVVEVRAFGHMHVTLTLQTHTYE
jgi:hypothetical protein